ncbi:MAG: o-succinylbenzoate--CoA ligase [Sporolactobacillus sp.]|jgi:O-succinylbenzoic acid--CoA ligase|nr:o-succinylbenzoate--CoA ligase [Sporolactobacillus sp.]
MKQEIMPNWLLQRARLTPERTAYETEAETLSFRELLEQTLRLAGKLARAGVRRGDHVALLAGNHLDSVRCLHALMMLGAVAVPLNTRLGTAEQAWQTSDSAARWLIHDRTHQQRAGEIAEEVNGIHLLNSGWPRQAEQTVLRPRPYFDLAEPCTIIYTSGTTGKPKGVVLTYGNHWWSAAGSVLNLGLVAADKWLCCVPLFHVSGLSILMKNVLYGMSVVLTDKFDPHLINRWIRAGGVTMISVVADMLRRLTDDLGAAHYPESFRCALLGGGPAPRPLLQRCHALGIPVYQTYGLTETASQMVTLPPEYMLSKSASAGKPLFPGEVRIQRTGEGRSGEILVRGMNVTRGYWQRPLATARAIQDGWLHTGDIGYLDDDGFLYVLDRRSDLIISGGENVYPAEIEAVLLTHPDVAEAGVIGIKDDRWGQVPYGFVRLRRDRAFSEQRLLDFCRSRLAHYKVPVGICPLERMPRNASRKLLRRKLFAFLPLQVKTSRS